ncbi:MAG: hypothetical protein SGJ11_14785 [Phycisphaerae bacterium]|nr:hypothetical protein [Phycisphaerae bacterium]
MKRSTIVSIALCVVGGLGLALNALVRPHGFGAKYVHFQEKTYVEADVGPALGEVLETGTQDPNDRRRVWLPINDTLLDRPNVQRTDKAPISWVEEVDITPVDAWARMTGPSGGADVSLSLRNTLGVWVAALFSLAVLSFLWRDNPVYKFAESVIVGVSAAYWVVNAFWSTLVPSLLYPLFPGLTKAWALPGTSGEYEEGAWTRIFPVILGVMLLMRLSRQAGWIAVWPLAFVIGTTAGIKLVSHVQADFLAQISSSVESLIKFDDRGAFDWGRSVGNIVLTVGLLSVLTYFFFSLEHKGVVGRAARLGVWFLMVSFGAAFAFTVMGRITLLSERFEFLFGDWLWLIDPKYVRTVAEAGQSVVSMITSAPR